MPPRVLHLVYNLIRGGTEGQCARVAMHFARMGHQHRVGVSVAEGYFLEAVEAECGPVYEMPIRRMLSLQTWREIRRLAGFLREGRFDLLHAWDADASIFGSMAAQRAGIPWITSRRDLGQIYSGRKLALMRRADRHASVVVVNAQAIARALIQEGLPRARMRLVPNMLDWVEFDKLANKPFSDHRRLPPHPRVLSVSRLDREKDISMLLHAVALLRDRGVTASLIIAGDGEERGRLESASESLGLRELVFFLGEVRDVPGLLREVDVGVLTPRWNEGLSNTILEYMAAELPVVATDCGGNRELVHVEETGILVQCGNAPAMADALERLLGDAPLRRILGMEGRRRVEKHFGPEIAVGHLSALYEELVQGEVCKS